MKRNILVSVFLLIALLATSYLVLSKLQTHDNDTHTQHLTYEVIRIETGFGYLIKLDDHILIKQKYVPSLSGNRTFLNHQDATAVAKLVVKKLTNKENPKITREDLEKLKIQIPGEN